MVGKNGHYHHKCLKCCQSKLQLNKLYRKKKDKKIFKSKGSFLRERKYFCFLTLAYFPQVKYKRSVFVAAKEL